MANTQVFKMGFMYRTREANLAFFEDLDKQIVLSADLGPLPDFGPRNEGDPITTKTYEEPHIITVLDAARMYAAIDMQVKEVLAGAFDPPKGDAVRLRAGARRLAHHVNDMLFKGQRRIRIIRKGSDTADYVEAARTALTQALKYGIPVLDLLALPASAFNGFDKMPEIIALGIDAYDHRDEFVPRLPPHYVFIESRMTRNLPYSHALDLSADADA